MIELIKYYTRLRNVTSSEDFVLMMRECPESVNSLYSQYSKQYTQLCSAYLSDVKALVLQQMSDNSKEDMLTLLIDLISKEDEEEDE